MDNEFYCKGSQLANYLIKHGSTLIRIDEQDGVVVYVFEMNDTIDKNIEKYEIDKNRCMF